MNDPNYMVPLIEQFVIENGRSPSEIYTITKHVNISELYFVMFFDNTFLGFSTAPQTLN